MASRPRFRPLKHVGVAKYIFLIAKSHTGHQTQTQPQKKQKMHGNTPPGFPRNSPELPGTPRNFPRNSPELPGTARNCPGLRVDFTPPRADFVENGAARGPARRFCRKSCRSSFRGWILPKWRDSVRTSDVRSKVYVFVCILFASTGLPGIATAAISSARGCRGKNGKTVAAVSIRPTRGLTGDDPRRGSGDKRTRGQTGDKPRGAGGRGRQVTCVARFVGTGKCHLTTSANRPTHHWNRHTCKHGPTQGSGSRGWASGAH